MTNIFCHFFPFFWREIYKQIADILFLLWSLNFFQYKLKQPVFWVCKFGLYISKPLTCLLKLLIPKWLSNIPQLILSYFLGRHSLMAGLKIWFQFFGKAKAPVFEEFSPVFFICFIFFQLHHFFYIYIFFIHIICRGHGTIFIQGGSQ